jgi:4-diphosphocytidyl-2-C-methyl-D-erythritol kinase
MHHEDFAPAKINLSLHVLGRRADGYHDLESLVVFADVGDRLVIQPGASLGLDVVGETAAATGPLDDNLVLKAARALAERVPGLRFGRFTLEKRLPVAAGLGGGSADAASALRLLARLNDLDPADPRIAAAAIATGSDVPVCLDTRPALMSGAGDDVVRLRGIPALHLVLVNPRVALETRRVFAGLGLAPGQRTDRSPHAAVGSAAALRLADLDNDLAAAAEAIVPEITTARHALRDAGAQLARMSGSGATVWGWAGDCADAAAIGNAVSAAYPHWWVATVRTTRSALV